MIYPPTLNRSGCVMILYATLLYLTQTLSFFFFCHASALIIEFPTQGLFCFVFLYPVLLCLHSSSSSWLAFIPLLRCYTGQIFFIYGLISEELFGRMDTFDGLLIFFFFFCLFVPTIGLEQRGSADLKQLTRAHCFAVSTSSREFCFPPSPPPPLTWRYHVSLVYRCDVIICHRYIII